MWTAVFARTWIALGIMTLTALPFPLIAGQFWILLELSEIRRSSDYEDGAML